MLNDIVSELVANLEAMISSSEYEVAVWPGILVNPSTTAIDIYPDTPFRGEGAGMSLDERGAYRFIVRARTGLNDSDAAQAILLDMLDDESDVCVAHAVEDDPTLNGYASDAFVSGSTGFVAYQAPEGTLVGVEWSVEILAAYS